MVIVSMSTSSELMITMEVLIYPILGLMILLLIYGLFGRASLTRRVTHNINITTDDCASEDCVRCNKYEAVIKRASSRYQTEDSLKTSVDDCSQRLSQAISNLEEKKEYQLTNKQQPNILYIDGLSAKPFWTDEDFVSDVAILESEMSAIVEEFENVYNNVWPKGWLVNTTPTGQWAVFHLLNQGNFIKPNCDICPKTTAILKKLVGAMTTGQNLFGNASFSVVQSGTHITPHYGPTNVRIRCHMGLRVSDPQSSYITVDGQKGSWQAGKCLIFDDSFLHSVHHSDVEEHARAVLLVDMWHPQLTDTERNLIENLFKYEKTFLSAPPAIRISLSTDL